MSTAPTPVPTTSAAAHPAELGIDFLAEEVRRLRAAVEVLAPKRPEGLEEYLSPHFETLIYDKGCNRAIGWGFTIIKKIPTETESDAASRLKKHGKIEFLNQTIDTPEGPVQMFGLITRWLSAEEATAKYGPRGEVTFGPRGGFKQVFYGATPFNHPAMKPEGVAPPKAPMIRVRVANERPIILYAETRSHGHEMELTLAQALSFDSIGISTHGALVGIGNATKGAVLELLDAASANALRVARAERDAAETKAL